MVIREIFYMKMLFDIIESQLVLCISSNIRIIKDRKEEIGNEKILSQFLILDCNKILKFKN